jgi:sugar (pentulose or hexulose) kinase
LTAASAQVAGDGSLLIGCDIGTSAVKAVLTSADGELIGHRVAEHPMHRPRPGWAENDPEDWCRGVQTTVRGLLRDASVPADRVAALAIVAQREPVVLADRWGRALTPSISWTDRRTAREAEAISDRLGREWLIDTTGMLPVLGSSLTQLLWLRRNQPQEWRQTRRILFAKDYILERLTGVWATDISTPGRSLMLDLARADWSDEICDSFGIDLDLLPRISHAPWELLGELRPGPARELGLVPGTPIAMGGADDAAATLGAGAIDPGEMCVGTGTATNWRNVLDVPKADTTGKSDVAPHVVPKRYIVEVAVESTGASFRWLRESLACDQSFDALIEEAQDVAPGADGLMFFPYVDGAGRAPHYIEGATGSLVGIVSGHTRAHVVRALLEGIAYQYPPTMDIVSALGDVKPPITTGDGEARSAAWNQIKADVLGVPLRVPRAVELAAAGAAILAGVAAGAFADAAAGVRAIVGPDRIFEPDPLRHDVYRDLRAAHEHVFSLIAPSSHQKEYAQ